MSKTWPCIFCDDQTDYHTTDGNAICIGCAREKGLELFNSFGRFLNLVRTTSTRTTPTNPADQPPFNNKKEPS